jgi:hypothetical protein
MMIGEAEYRTAARNGLLPKELPKSPESAYRQSGWQSTADWLGVSRKSTVEKSRGFRPFTEVLEFAKSLGLKSKNDWFRWVKSNKLPDGIPANPSEVYKPKGWHGWAHFLGTKNIKAGEAVSRDFISAREWARSFCNQVFRRRDGAPVTM